MSFIQIAYSITVPFILLLSFFGSKAIKLFSINLISISNRLLIGYSIFLIRQLVGLYQLSKQLSINEISIVKHLESSDFGLLLMIVLPFFSLFTFFQKSKYFSLLLLFLLYWNVPFFVWNKFTIFFNLLTYFSLFISAYSLLWLFNKLPYQFKKE